MRVKDVIGVNDLWFSLIPEVGGRICVYSVIIAVLNGYGREHVKDG